MVWPLRIDDHDLNSGSLLHSDITLIVYGGSQITHHGTIALTCSYKREVLEYAAFIGLQSSTDFKLFICNFTIHENVTTPCKRYSLQEVTDEKDK